LDPEHKYLSHSFVESPDMMNVYNGNAILDENGRATVELPDYFEARKESPTTDSRSAEAHRIKPSYCPRKNP
jgi:hypothetical protein